MKQHLHQEFDAGPGDVIEVTLSGQANVMLMDPVNYNSYKRGEKYRYHGGRALVTPFRIAPPTEGRWHLVIDLGGYPGTVQAGVRVLQHANG